MSEDPHSLSDAINQSGPGIDLKKLKHPVRLCVSTRNSTYDINLTDGDGWAEITGGEYMPGPTRAKVNGCTWGRSMIRVGWLAPGMHMELYVPSLNTTITTTRIRNAKIMGDGWEFDLQWDKLRGRSGAT
jgi:hypothetical protein